MRKCYIQTGDEGQCSSMPQVFTPIAVGRIIVAAESDQEERESKFELLELGAGVGLIADQCQQCGTGQTLRHQM